MQLDARFLAEMDPDGVPLVHFYDWEGDSASYGHFIKIEDFLHLEEAGRRGLNLARRPTGGGIVFHIWDFAFSALIPSGCSLFSKNTLDNYELINQAVLKAVHQLRGGLEFLDLTHESPKEISSFCMAAPTIYDVVIGEKKVAGAAQRQRKNGFLHQGTISLVRPPEEYLGAILKDPQIIKAMNATILPVLGEQAGELEPARKELKHLLANTLKETI